jgi:hypothetical protein
MRGKGEWTPLFRNRGLFEDVLMQAAKALNEWVEVNKSSYGKSKKRKKKKEKLFKNNNQIRRGETRQGRMRVAQYDEANESKNESGW